MSKKIVTVILLIIFFQFNGITQERYYLETGYQYGYVFPTNSFLKGINPEFENITVYQTGNLRFGLQTDTSKLWYNLFKQPSYGLQLYVASFFEPDFLGTPISIAGFFNAPFIKKKRFEFGYDFSLGAAFNWKSFNPISNNTNISIGARQSFYVELGLHLKQKLTSHLDLTENISFTHFSNGALKEPNYGINTFAPKLALRYNFYNETINYNKFVKPKFIKNNQIDVYVFGGVKNVIFDSVNVDLITKYEGVYFPVYGGSFNISRQVNHKSKFGLGITTTVDHSIDAQIAIDEDDLEIQKTSYFGKFELSIFPSYELIIGPVSAIIQPSFYLFRNKKMAKKSKTYQRLGIRYHFKSNLFIGMNLRAYDYHVSDFMEWNIGYTSWIQVINATLSLNNNLSITNIGFSKLNLFLGRLFSLSSTALTCSFVIVEKSDDFLKYCLINPFKFSLDPLSQEW